MKFRRPTPAVAVGLIALFFALGGIGTAAEPALARPAEESGQPDGGASCRVDVEAVFWTGEDWQRLANALASNPSPCAEYWISIPPRATPKTMLRRPEIFEAIRALGPQFHPVAEITLGTQTGWAKWVEQTGATWYEAGVEFRRRMAAAGLDPAAGETWLLNEFDRSTRVDAVTRTDVEIRNGLDVLPYRRADMLELLRGLYEGDGTVPVAAGAVEIGINFSHQDLPDLDTYRREMASWLEDGAFWSKVDGATRWLMREAYPDSLLWGVESSSRNERTQRLADYIFHTLDLANAGPPAAEAAATFFQRAFLPLANAGWAALGGAESEYVTHHGSTLIPPDQMQRFVSEQVYAIRHYALTNTHGGPEGRLGFSWQPFNRLELPAADYQAALNAITARLASAIAFAYGQGSASPEGACGEPGTGGEWCKGVNVPGAAFSDAWESLDEWPGEG